MRADNQRIMDGEEPAEGSVNEVKEMPDAFAEWVAANQGRLAKAQERGTLPYFLRDNEWALVGNSSAKKGLTGNMLGRTATKAAYSAYKDEGAIQLSETLRKNAEAIASTIGIARKNMTFMEANNGRANPQKGKGRAYRDNCQSCVVVHEARLRGLDIVARGYSSNTSSAVYKLSEDTSMAWITANGKTVKPTLITARGGTDIYTLLDKATSQSGRYHVGINIAGGGHIIVAERRGTGKIYFYDPQNGTFVNIREFLDVESFEVLRVDKLLLRPEVVRAIAEFG